MNKVLFLVTLTTLSLLSACTASRSLVGPSPDQRRHVLETVAGFDHTSFEVVAARLRTGRQTELAWRQLDTLLASPTGDIFWMYPATAFYFCMRDELDDAWRARFREDFKHYTPYRGDTENHFLMYYSSLYLMTQEWPGLDSTEWFNGKSSAENHAEAQAYLDDWIDQTVRHGSTEWDSPRYLYYYITPLLTMATYARDERMKQRCEMMLEYMLADYAVDYLDGNYCGAHSREGDNSVIDPRSAEATSYGQFYFEDSVSFVLPDLAFAAMSEFSVPPIIRRIAHERDEPFVHTELKRSRAKIRNSSQRYTPVYRYSYMTPAYCIGSIQGGLQEPIQQHTWDITFRSKRPNNTIFTLHPQASAYELGTFFPEEPELMEQGILASKASYGSPDKWIGGSPFEEIHQTGPTLLALYDIPRGWRFPHVDLFLPKTLDTLVRDTSGWIVARMDSALVGIHPFDSNVTWIDEQIDWRVRSFSRKTGFVVETERTSQMTLAQFIAALRPHRPLFGSQTGQLGPDFAYNTIRGQRLTVLSGEHAGEGILLVDGRPADSHSHAPPLFNGPFLTSPPEGGVLRMQADGETRTLDFVRNEIREEKK